MRYTTRMLKVRDKRLLRTILFGRVGIVVFGIIVAVLANATWSVYQKSQFARESRDRAAQELEKLEEREASLAEEMERLATERGIEEELRHKFDVGREGERLVVLVDAPEAPAPPLLPKRTWWYTISEFFGFR